MSTPINPQEIYLLERYISLDYFGEMRDAWVEMIKHLENCLDQFMQNLPLDYRNRPLPEQPDAVWGERVLPNFRDTFHHLCNGYIQILHNDFGGLGHASRISNDRKGQTDFWDGWMSRDDQNTYGDLLHLASMRASNIDVTEGAHWNAGTLTTFYDEGEFGSLNPPANWPQYKLNPHIQVASGQKVKQCGIYVPDVDNSCAQFLSVNYDETPEASVFVRMRELFHPVTKIKYGETPEHEKRPCIWTLVERVADDGGTSTAPSLLNQKTHRVPANQACPESGFYFTPAKADSRRHFKQGDIMPSVGNDYGMTIWQWDEQQN